MRKGVYPNLPTKAPDFCQELIAHGYDPALSSLLSDYFWHFGYSNDMFLNKGKLNNISVLKKRITLII